MGRDPWEMKTSKNMTSYAELVHSVKDKQNI